ncbi:hypothetical protein R3P38DRAFT_2463868, partial [Favolaschia claudopus]
STIPQLQSHIYQLSYAIEAQTLILHGLMTQRSEARRKLNRFLDPMARLPLELQSHIFLAVDLDVDPPKPHPDAPPMVFLSVCGLWRDIALATPKLWDRLSIDYPSRRPHYSELGKLWLSRARSHPLLLSLHGALSLDGSAQDLVATYSNQLEHLSLRALSPYSLESPCTNFHVNPALRLPLLKTLSFDADREANFGNMREWLRFLAAASELSSLTLCNASFNDFRDYNEPGSFYLASLDTLHLGRPCTWTLTNKHGCNANVLRHLTLPALKVLSVSHFNLHYQDFLAFPTRSSPRLESLHI